jgi:hypothetical protein
MHGHAVEGAKTLDQAKLIGIAPCFCLRIKRFRGIREIFKESRTQPAFHVEQVAGFFTLNSEIEVV